VHHPRLVIAAAEDVDALDNPNVTATMPPRTRTVPGGGSATLREEKPAKKPETAANSLA